MVATAELQVPGTQNSPSKVLKALSSIKKKRVVGGGRKALTEQSIIQKLKDFVDDRRGRDLSVSKQLVVAEWRRVDPVGIRPLSQDAIRSRVRRMFRKWGLSYRRGTHKAQNTRYCILVISDFVEHVKFRIRALGVGEDDVFNVDQTNIKYSMESRNTYATTGTKTVAILGSESSNRCTVMLGCSLSGNYKLQPYLIFKGSSKTTGRIYQEIKRRVGFPEDCQYGVQEKAWMNEDQMLEWIKLVWKPFAVSRGSRLLYLILDECPTHLTSKVKRAFDDCRTEIDFIPGGYTAKLQPLDIGINKPFKNYVTESFEAWLVANTTNNKPLRQDVSNWISEAWNMVSKTTMVNSWKRIMGRQNIVNNEVLEEVVEEDHEIESDDDNEDFLALE
jgi:hypothetical protein